MEIDPGVAAGLGFPKLRYVFVEHELLWLCKSVPADLVSDAEEILDLYVTGSNLRLRAARSISGGAPTQRLFSEGGCRPHSLASSAPSTSKSLEYVLLRAARVGRELRKRRLQFAPRAEPLSFAMKRLSNTNSR